jgi:para-aminobenzoate synthetase
VKLALTTKHGIVDPIHHDSKGLFDKLPNPLQVVRYHSLAVSAKGERQLGSADSTQT